MGPIFLFLQQPLRSGFKRMHHEGYYFSRAFIHARVIFYVTPTAVSLKARKDASIPSKALQRFDSRGLCPGPSKPSPKPLTRTVIPQAPQAAPLCRPSRRRNGTHKGSTGWSRRAGFCSLHSRVRGEEIAKLNLQSLNPKPETL